MEKENERCPLCGRLLRRWKNPAAAENGLKGGRPHHLNGGRPKGSKNKKK